MLGIGLGAGIKKYINYRRGKSGLMEVSPGYWRSMEETSLMKLEVCGGWGVAAEPSKTSWRR